MDIIIRKNTPAGTTYPAKEEAWMPNLEEFYFYSHSSVVR